MYTHKYRCMNRIKHAYPRHGRIYILLYDVHYDTVRKQATRCTLRHRRRPATSSTPTQVSVQSFIIQDEYYNGHLHIYKQQGQTQNCHSIPPIDSINISDIPPMILSINSGIPQWIQSIFQAFPYDQYGRQ